MTYYSEKGNLVEVEVQYDSVWSYDGKSLGNSFWNFLQLSHSGNTEQKQ